ncbi:dephospho-CoA kinase [Cognatiyoonia sediminum]|uniref:Dephospho-CoA kinase n=1 Tax=Cognatiyoonia sediminum TaxID=1508389 RepID=A0A1M5QNN5_9RHOB|nr:dephospho-CoA kinase [Cognatiyoonia sediminum]SHH15695.1 dephospho-CoA kinase [Cognatiyoonia sediminum]
MKQFCLGLTGSIGMGKTTTANMFREEGISVWDADETVHRLYGAGGKAVPEIEKVFPEAIVDGAVSRPKLREVIQADLAALGTLEAIVHPLVAADRQTFRSENNGLIVFDIPLLFETSADQWLDAVLVVSTDEDTQKQRVFSRDGMTKELFEDILSRQIPDTEKQVRADFVIETASLEQTRADVRDLISQLTEKLSHA